MAQAAMTFPPDFLWGTATSAHQVEGFNTNNDWWAWEQEDGRILNGHRSGAACNWWDDAEADLDRAADLGTNAHRLSLEWSRIEPEPGRFDTEALARYREILLGLRERGIEPMVTLHHFSNPLWLVEKQDFNAEIVVDYFRRYAEHAVMALGDLVPRWITINEPMVYIFLRYMAGDFPRPSRPGLAGAREAVVNLLRCHAAAYHTIRAHRPETAVGIAKNMPVFEARPGSGALAKGWARQVDQIFNHAWLQAMVDGRVPRPFGRGRIPGLAGSFDFLGVNYYTRFYVKFPPGRGLLEEGWGPEATVSDGNYGEVYAYGLYHIIRQVLRYNKPIYITENGIPDSDDDLRPAFILDHLRQIWHALTFCYPVMGYFHWSLVDNFEWDRGWTQRFGLFELDPATQERRPRPSAALYSEICHAKAITSEMTGRYAAELLPLLFPGAPPSLKGQHVRF